MSTKKELVELYETLTNGAEKELKPGMFAKWKPGLKNHEFPKYDEPVIVTRHAHIFDDKADGGTCYFMKPLDIVLGIIGKNDDFLEFHYDSRRFMPA